MKDKFLVTFEQIRRGCIYFLSLKNRSITSVGIYTTNRCNSRCKTCNIWQKRKKEDISLKAIKNILDKDNFATQYFLSGGEFILHPEHEKILKLFSGKNYILLSNGILSKKLISLVKKYTIKRVVLSFDGVGETYTNVRGVDNFDNLHWLIHELKKICTVSLNFTINPLNNKKGEIFKAERFAQEHEVYLALGIYDLPEYFESQLPKTKIPKLLPQRKYPLNKYLSYYNQWVEKKYTCPCLSIRNSCMILPDGSMSLCQGKNIIVGNVNQHNLQKIWNGKLSRQKQDEFLGCQDCWLLCQKPMDIFAWDIIQHIPTKLRPGKLRKF